MSKRKQHHPESKAKVVLEALKVRRKTSSAEEVSNVLVGRSVPHTLLDLDCLAETYPRDPNDRFGSKLMLTNLRSVWRNVSVRPACTDVP